MANNVSEELKELRLELIDRLSSYGVTVKELYPFDDEARAISEMPLKRREKAFNELCNKIRAHYKKMRRIK